MRQDNILNPPQVANKKKFGFDTALYTSTRSESRGTVTCSYCNFLGHTEDTCYKKDPSKAPPEMQKRMKELKERKDRTKCFICTKLGHYNYECPELKDIIAEHKEKKETQKKKQKAKKDNSDSESDKDAQSYFVTISNKTSAFLATVEEVDNKDRDKNFIIDSGATHHMSSKKQLFRNIKPYNKKVTIADENLLTAQGKGDIAVTYKYTDKVDKAEHLKNVLYVPELKRSLLSVATINDQDYDVTFKRNGKVLVQDDNGNIIAEGFRKGRLYYLSANIIESKDNLTLHPPKADYNDKAQSQKKYKNAKWKRKSNKKKTGFTDASNDTVKTVGILNAENLNAKDVPIEEIPTTEIDFIPSSSSLNRTLYSHLLPDMNRLFKWIMN